jgi:hypothetical protein
MRNHSLRPSFTICGTVPTSPTPPRRPPSPAQAVGGLHHFYNGLSTIVPCCASAEIRELLEFHSSVGAGERVMFDRQDLEAVSKAYSQGKAVSGLLCAHKKACDALVSRHPELRELDEATLSQRLSLVLSTAVLTHYLEL